MREFDRIKQDIYDATPQYYHEIIEAQEILDRHAELLSEIHIDANDVLDQFFIDTATWGLSYWEKMVGITGSDKSTFDEIEEDLVTFSELEYDNWSVLEVKYPDELEERRSRVKALIRGQGTVTLQHIKDVVRSYAGGDVDAINDPANYKIIIRFVDENAVPENLDEVKAVIRDMAPAHIALEYTLMYLLIKDIEQTMTLSTLETKTLNQFAGGVL